jgi:hypothetical protein
MIAASAMTAIILSPLHGGTAAATNRLDNPAITNEAQIDSLAELKILLQHFAPPHEASGGSFAGLERPIALIRR